jgi:hypothetical protein
MGNSPLTPEQKHKRELEERGVLIPPVFGVGTERSRWEQGNFHPSLMTRLEQDSLTYRLLHQHLKPGVWIASQTNATGSVKASLVPLQSIRNDIATSNGTSTWSDPQGFLRVSQPLTDELAINVSYHSHQSPNIAATLNVAQNVKVSSKLDAQGLGWLSAQYRTSVHNFFLSKDPDLCNPFSEGNDRRRLDLHFGSWVDVEAQKDWSKSAENLLSSIPAAHAYASLQVPGCLLAVQGKLPTNSYEKLPELSYHATCDLTNNDSKTTTNNNAGPPPLAVTIRKSGQSSSMALSQVLTWDRYIANALETRCPKILNTLAWTVALEKTAESSSAAKPRAGVAWQLNRALAVKAVAQPDGLQAAVIFKRWRQPRITCACLFGTGRFGNFEFQGLGVTLEVGGGSDAADAVYNEDSASTIVSPLVPETKATLPK